MKKLCALLFLFPSLLFAKDLELKTTITDVTVFQNGAQVKRSGVTTIPAGEFDVIIRDATPLLKKESLQVKGEGSFTILSVNYESRNDEVKEDKTKVDELEARKKVFIKKDEELRVKLGILRAEADVIYNLRSVSTTTQGVTVEQVIKAQEMIRLKLTQIKNEELAVVRDINDNNDKHKEVLQQLNALQSPMQSVKNEIIIRVSAKAEARAEFDINYIVPNARWFPAYDLRVNSVSEPLVIEYKANVTQQSGEDWNNVKLKLSTGDPSQSSTKPKILPWMLYLNQAYVQPVQQSNYYKYTDARMTRVRGKVRDAQTGEELPFCTVMVNGTNIGCVTDINGEFNLNLPEGSSQLKVTYVGYQTATIPISGDVVNINLQPSVTTLNEVSVSVESVRMMDKDIKVNSTSANYSSNGATTVSATGATGGYGYTWTGSSAASVPVTVTQTLNIVSTEFVIDEKYTLASSKKQISVTIQSIKSPAKYQYYCAPRLDKDVFLTAMITDWEQYNLLEGQANVFFEGTFIGNTLLDTRYLTDTLNISLGRDKSIKVERKKSKEYSKKQVLGSDMVTYRHWDISVRNGKRQKIDIIIEDQFPIAANNTLEVKQEEKSGATLDEKTGILTWNFNIEPGGNKSVQLRYSVKHPKGTFVGLD